MTHLGHPNFHGFRHAATRRSPPGDAVFFCRNRMMVMMSVIMIHRLIIIMISQYIYIHYIIYIYIHIIYYIYILYIYISMISDHDSIVIV